MGSTITLVIYITLAIYSIYKTQFVVQRGGFTMAASITEDFFDETDSFSHKQGLALAAALFSNENFAEDLDPAMGRIFFKVEGWGFDKDGEFYELSEELESHFCTERELGLLGEEGS